MKFTLKQICLLILLLACSLNASTAIPIKTFAENFPYSPLKSALIVGGSQLLTAAIVRLYNKYKKKEEYTKEKALIDTNVAAFFALKTAFFVWLFKTQFMNKREFNRLTKSSNFGRKLSQYLDSKTLHIITPVYAFASGLIANLT